jgi:hypothetical protein
MPAAAVIATDHALSTSACGQRDGLSAAYGQLVTEGHDGLVHTA